MKISEGFKEIAKSMPYIREIAVGLVITVLIVGVFVYQSTSGSINVGSTSNTSLLAIETGMSTWNTNIVSVVGTVVGLIILYVIMKLMGNKDKKGSNMG